MRKLRYWAIAGALSLAISPAPSGAPAAAQDITGSLEATTFDTLPPDAAFQVRPERASGLGAEIAALIEEVLVDEGRSVAADAPFVISFRWSGDLPLRRPERNRIELRGGFGSSNEDADAQVRVEVFRLGPREGGERRGRVLTIAIADRAGSRFWQAEVQISRSSGDDRRDIAVLMPAIVAEFGRRVFAKRIP